MRTVLFITLAAACSSATAGPPAKMPEKEASQLDAALMHLRDAQRQREEAIAAVNRMAAEARVYEEEALAICKAYQINPAELGKSVLVEFRPGPAKGQITRMPKPSPSPAPKGEPR